MQTAISSGQNSGVRRILLWGHWGDQHSPSRRPRAGLGFWGGAASQAVLPIFKSSQWRWQTRELMSLYRSFLKHYYNFLVTLNDILSSISHTGNVGSIVIFNTLEHQKLSSLASFSCNSIWVYTLNLCTEGTTKTYLILFTQRYSYSCDRKFLGVAPTNPLFGMPLGQSVLYTFSTPSTIHCPGFQQPSKKFVGTKARLRARV